MPGGRLIGKAAKALAKGVRRRVPKQQAIDQRVKASMARPTHGQPPEVPPGVSRPLPQVEQDFWQQHFEEIRQGLGMEVAVAAVRGDATARAEIKAWVKAGKPFLEDRVAGPKSLPHQGLPFPGGGGNQR